jgi:AhpD family alkylhydroperoxidase
MTPRLDFYKARPEAIKAMSALESHIGKSALEKPLVELVRLRASQINGCAYCTDLHAADAMKSGEDARRLSTLSSWRETPFFSERERAALDWTEALTLVAEEHVPDRCWDAANQAFSAEEIVDLTLLIVAINGWNRFAIAFRKTPS